MSEHFNKLTPAEAEIGGEGECHSDMDAARIIRKLAGFIEAQWKKPPEHFDSGPVRPTVGDVERNQLRRLQADGVVLLIGGLLDSWDQLSGDMKNDPELEILKKQIELIERVMENPYLEKNLSKNYEK